MFNNYPEHYSSFPIYFIDKGVVAQTEQRLSPHVNVKQYKNKHRLYTMVNLKTPAEGEAEQDVEMQVALTKYRSVVLDEKGQKVLSFGMPHSISLTAFRAFNFPAHEVTVTGIEEGTMVSLFHDSAHGGVWDISTKTAVGGNYRFSRAADATKRPKSFREMFNEAFFAVLAKKNNVFLLDHSSPSPASSLDVSGAQEQKLLADFPTDHVFTFVLQHPENHIILDVQRPRVVVVAVYQRLQGDDCCVVGIPLKEFRGWRLLDGFECAREEEAAEDGEDQLLRDRRPGHYTEVGVMLTHDKTGLRAHAKNDSYLAVAQLRGNHANLKFHYFQMRQQSRVQQFLLYFPRYLPLFQSFYDEFRLFVTDFHQHYLCYFVKKKADFCAPSRFTGVLFQIHQIYHANKRENKHFRITERIVENFFDNLPPALLLSLLSEKRRFDAKAAKDAATTATTTTATTPS